MINGYFGILLLQLLTNRFVYHPCLLTNLQNRAIMAIDDVAPERSVPEMMVAVKCNGDTVHHPDEETDLPCGSPEAVCLYLFWFLHLLLNYKLIE